MTRQHPLARMCLAPVRDRCLCTLLIGHTGAHHCAHHTRRYRAQSLTTDQQTSDQVRAVRQWL